MSPPVLKSFPITGWPFVLPCTVWLLLAYHPFIIGFWQWKWVSLIWPGKHIVYGKYLHETEKTSGKIMGGETRSRATSCWALGTEEIGQEQFLLAQSADSAKFCSVSVGNESHTPANPNVASVNPLYFFSSKLRMKCELWMELFIPEGSIFLYLCYVYAS